ncbi:MAG: SH3 domain-containing protein [Lachnospiraceae bacterium]|nr:SH3 domain-containing protein [Lachnospiraceae bacterium]
MRRRKFMDEFGPVIFYTVIALMVVVLFFVCFAFSRRASAPASAGTGAESGAPSASASHETGASGESTEADPAGTQGVQEPEGGDPGSFAGDPGVLGTQPGGENPGGENPGGEPAADPAGDPGASSDGTDPGGTSPAGADSATVTSPDGTVFTVVNETVYAQDNVNMRTAPSASGSILAILKKGQSATRTGVSEFGWSQIVYEGNTVYVSSDYIGTAAP